MSSYLTNLIMLELVAQSPGELFASRYKLVRVLGTGGMGSVFLAQDQLHDNLPVAVKLLHYDLAKDERFLKRFIKEADITRAVSHPAIVKIFDINIKHAPPYFTLEYIDGQTVHELFENEELPADKLPWLLEEICQALIVVHRDNIVHRDIKTKNVIISKDWQVKLTDFGIARCGASDLTEQHEVVGSGPYMAPEIWGGAEPSPQADLYALGVMFYFLYTGQMPFLGSSSSELMLSHLKGLQAAPIEINPDMPLWANQLIVELLDSNICIRPDSAETVIQKVKQALAWKEKRAQQVHGEVDMPLPTSAFDRVPTPVKIETPRIAATMQIKYPVKHQRAEFSAFAWKLLGVLTFLGVVLLLSLQFHKH